MKPLSRLENLIAEIVERPAWLLSSRRLHPLELSTALTRALEERALRLADRVLAPDDYTVSLNPADLASYGDATAVLERELGDYLARLVVERDLSCNRAPTVHLVASPAVRAGRAEVEARFSAPADAPTVTGSTAARRRPAPNTATSASRPAEPPSTSAARPEARVRGPALLLLGAGGETRATFPLDRGPLTIGRRATAEIPLADAKVSREHARVERTPQGCTITDLGSLNGTFVSGERLAGACLLRDGDTIAIGHSRFRFVEGR